MNGKGREETMMKGQARTRTGGERQDASEMIRNAQNGERRRCAFWKKQRHDAPPALQSVSQSVSHTKSHLLTHR